MPTLKSSSTRCSPVCPNPDGLRVYLLNCIWITHCAAEDRPISEDDAIEILTNVRRLAEILLRAEEEKRAAQRPPVAGKPGPVGSACRVQSRC
jgi:hypothetical protein